VIYLPRLRIPRVECVDFASGPGAKVRDESAISSLCNKVNCAARENALGCSALRYKEACYKRGFLNVEGINRATTYWITGPGIANDEFR